MNADSIITGIISIITLIIGVAIIAVLVSSKAQTAQVLQAGGGAIGNILSTALSPVTGTTGISSAATSYLPPGFNLTV